MKSMMTRRTMVTKQSIGLMMILLLCLLVITIVLLMLRGRGIAKVTVDVTKDK